MVVTAMDVVGTLAASLTTLSFVPQVMKVWQTRSGADISTLMYAVFIAGVALWLVYGLMLGAWPVILANGATILLAATVLVLKAWFARSKPG